ncbi:polysaccharide deacetylase family protein [Pseudarthrobacter psychrotolerans]|uniref:Polysaccharide deacetylase family protein n=1 Tax=Pseudarthrobacter psychrotolerans TaxID=2697569 RepID=A0A6P1NR90_9MICC|nr:polysaccharide deacetylase family protein [Pseudarthrobacter psychrotolerans]QHK20052.1 polysaccharide deacetylase family protein [Pseudarthrobacter psychrotolerans]
MLLNPLVVFLVVVVMVTTGWLLYTGGTSSIARARPGANLLPALDLTAAGAPASSGPSASAGPVGGWNVSHSGDSRTSLELVGGQVSDHALELDITGYASGDVTLTSPRVDVQPGKSYLFKAFATSDADFLLLARKHHADGSTTLEQLRNPLERPGNFPFTVSDAFDSGNTTTAVEYVFRLVSQGTLRVEGAYLEAADDVRLPPVARTAPNLAPNLGPALGPAGAQPGAPGSWSPYASGASAVESGRGEDKAGSFLWTRIANYQNGEAKWQYPPVPVTADRYFEFRATYQSEREVDVVAEFELADGGREFHNLETVLPAGEWTTITEAFQVPDRAKTAMVTLVSHGDGTTSVRDCSLTEVTKPGPLRWDQPMVSITFDDGWQSVHDRALPLLNKHGFRSTQYFNPSSIETPNFMTAAEVQQMHEAGHEIAAHSYDHVDLTSIGTDRLDEELRKSKEALAAAGIATNDLATPYGRSDPQVDWYASKYFDIVRGTDDGINTRQNLDPHDLKVFYVTDETTPHDLAEALAETSRVNGWLILVYHQISTPKSTGTQENTVAADRSTVTSDVLAAQLQLIDQSGIKVQPVAQAFKQLQGR